MNEALATSRRIYELLVAKTTAPPPAMRSWTGETWGPADAATTVVLRHPGALRSTLFPPSDLVAGEAYVYDDIDIEGAMFPLLHWSAELDAMRSSPRAILQLARLLRSLPTESRRREATRPDVNGRLHSRRRDRAAVRHHYDTGNDFFELFLDPEMVYSCAYFLDDNEKLADAQRRKLDLICRKLQLRPGQRLLDVGCGWGALVRHAAANYGVEAVGVTLSPQQAREAEKRNQLYDLSDRITIRVQDYRDVVGEFDAISSVGMFEHVGAKQLETYFTKLCELLTPQGILLNHGITTRSRAGRFERPKKSFVNTYVFPDGELLPIEQSIEAAEASGFETRDVENLRANYALTLRHWVSNLEANREAAMAAADELTYRIWRMYMSGSVAAFELGAIAVYQTVYTRQDREWTFGRTWAAAGDDL
jgi:cyclopropane-fatty-acyl-phospholipid synthase